MLIIKGILGLERRSRRCIAGSLTTVCHRRDITEYGRQTFEEQTRYGRRARQRRKEKRKKMRLDKKYECLRASLTYRHMRGHAGGLFETGRVICRLEEGTPAVGTLCTELLIATKPLSICHWPPVCSKVGTMRKLFAPWTWKKDDGRNAVLVTAAALSSIVRHSVEESVLLGCRASVRGVTLPPTFHNAPQK
jgi:hypothetical protein